MTRPRAADDFPTIRERLEELRRERDSSAAAPRDGSRPAEEESETERRYRERREGLPPPWVPTIFLGRREA